VRLSAVSILHGDLSIEIATDYQVSQPLPFSNTGQTTVVPETTVESKDEKVKRIELGEGASVEQLVNGLQAIGRRRATWSPSCRPSRRQARWRPTWR